MVSNASEDFPDPDNPVMTVSESRGIVTSMSLRLCSRAPETTIWSTHAESTRGEHVFAAESVWTETNFRIFFAMSEDILRPIGSSPSQPGLRASDADRDQLAGELRAHAVAGRIDTDE